MTRSTTRLPENYRQVYHLSILDENTLLMLNIFAVVLLIVFAGLTQFWQGGNTADWGISIVWGIPGVIGVLMLHEWIHGVAIRWAGQTPRYGVKTARIGRVAVPMALFATPQGDVYFRRIPFIIIALAPVVVITLLGWLLIALSPDDQLDWILSLAVIINGSGAAGDIWMTYTVLKYDADALVKDEEDTIRVFAPIADPPASSAH